MYFKTMLLIYKLSTNIKEIRTFMKQLYLFGIITPWSDTNTAAVRRALRNMDKDEELVIYLSSPGGSVFEAIEMYNLLKESSTKITIKIMGEASSAASLIACASNEGGTEIAETAIMMIHNPSVWEGGDEHYKRKVADNLATIKTAVMQAYVRKTGIKPAELSEMMDITTYMTADEAVAKGFADKTFVPNGALTMDQNSPDATACMKFVACSSKTTQDYNKFINNKGNEIMPEITQEKFDLLARERDDVKAQNGVFVNQITDLKTEIADLNKNGSTMTEEIKTLKTENDNLKSVNNKLEMANIKAEIDGFCIKNKSKIIPAEMDSTKTNLLYMKMNNEPLYNELKTAIEARTEFTANLTNELVPDTPLNKPAMKLTDEMLSDKSQRDNIDQMVKSYQEKHNITDYATAYTAVLDGKS